METKQSPAFGEWLQHRRRMLGLTQEELAERAELSVRQLVYLEQGKHLPRPGTIRRLSEALELSEEDRTILLESVGDRDSSGQAASGHGPGGVLVLERGARASASEGVVSFLRRGRRLLLAGRRSRAGLWRGALAAGVAALILGLAVGLRSTVTNSSGAQLALRPRPVAVWGPPPQHVQRFSQPDGIAVDHLGNVYVADFDRNAVQKLSSGGQPIAEFGSGRGAGAHFDGPTAVTVDAAGNLYVIDHGNRRLQKLSPEGAELGSWPVHANGVAADGHGHIDIVDGSMGVVRELSTDGVLLATWGLAGTSAGQAIPSQLQPPAGSALGIAVDTRGRVYIADADHHRFEVVSGTGHLLLVHRITEVPAPGDPLPEALTVDGNGDVYVADTGDALVLKYGPDGRFLARWGAASAGSGAFGLPDAVAVDGHGSLYVADAQTARVDKLSADGRFVASWTRMGSNEVSFEDPVDLGLDGQGNLYVLERESARVEKVSPDGRLIASWPVGRLSQSAPDRHEGVVSAMAVDRGGRVYVAAGDDLFVSTSYRVEGWSPDGRLLHTIYGLHYATGLAVDSHDNLWIAEQLAAVSEYSPTFDRLRRWTSVGPLMTNWIVGIAVDGQGNVYVPDSALRQVIKLSPGGKILAEFTEQGPPIFDSGPSSEAVDRRGRVYLAEPDRNEVQVLSPTGKLLQTLGRKGSVPGEFTTPVRVALDARGNLYVLDAERSYTIVPGDGRLQKFAPGG